MTTEFVLGITGADLAACENAGSFLQSVTWGRFKSRFGWKANAFLVEWALDGRGSAGETQREAHREVRPLLVLSRRIAPSIRMAYVPWGPELPASCNQGQCNRALAELAHSLGRHLPGNTTFVRFDPPWFDPEGGKAQDLSSPFVRAAADIQPPDTVIVDLAPDADNILASMKPKWRYNIGLAEKRGVTVNLAPAGEWEKDIGIFYGLLAETAKRDGIAVHGIGYYRMLFEEYGGAIPAGLRLYTAWHDGDCLAAIVALFRGEQATYLYGASSNAKRNLMAPYALQWRAMMDAKAAGCTKYDLFGIPPNGDPGHPMAGLYRFKTGFGGSIVHRPGSWDYPTKPVLYALFSTAERLRKKLRDRRKRRSG